MLIYWYIDCFWFDSFIDLWTRPWGLGVLLTSTPVRVGCSKKMQPYDLGCRVSTPVWVECTKSAMRIAELALTMSPNAVGFVNWYQRSSSQIERQHSAVAMLASQYWDNRQTKINISASTSVQQNVQLFQQNSQHQGNFWKPEISKVGYQARRYITQQFLLSFISLDTRRRIKH